MTGVIEPKLSHSNESSPDGVIRKLVTWIHTLNGVYLCFNVIGLLMSLYFDLLHSGIDRYTRIQLMNPLNCQAVKCLHKSDSIVQPLNLAKKQKNRLMLKIQLLT